MSVTLKNALGQTVTMDNVLALTVKEKVSSFEEIKTTTVGTKVIFNFGIKNPPTDLEKFKIAYGENPESFGSEVITWNTGKIMKNDGRFEWYIDKLGEKTYAFKILGLRSDGTLIESLTSETLSATI